MSANEGTLMKVLMVNQNEVSELLSMKDCIHVMKQAFRSLSEGKATVNPRTGLWISQEKLLGMMPSYLADIETAGLKITTVFPENSGTRFHVHQGVTLLFETTHGCLKAIIDSAEITTIRTGAASGLATLLLARPEAGDLAILGAGVQGSCHLEAMHTVRKLHRVRVWDISPERAMKFAQRESMQYGIAIEVMATVKDAVMDADLICIATPAKKPVLLGEWVKPGTHINSVGWSGPAARELDTNLLHKSRLFVDFRDSILRDCGDILIPLQEGDICEENILGSLGDIIREKIAGRQDASQITLYKSAGVGVQDLATAHFIYEQAIEKKKGVFIELGGFNQLEENH
jgi:alanine dehydrogenase